MNAKPTDRRRHSAQGFTLVELVAVLLLIGILAAVAVPRLTTFDGFRTQGWREQVVTGLRLAQTTATGHRRLVCASFSGNSLSLSIAAVSGATSCSDALPGPDGATSFTATAPERGVNVSISPPGTIYFQPNGRVSSDGAGTLVATRTLTAGDANPITVYGESGHVE
jgi:MSHA pilin protein MshC